MGKKRFEYQHKDMPALKKDISLRILFAILFFGVFVWQLVSLIASRKSGQATTVMTVIATIVLIFSILFVLVAVLYAIHDATTIKQINKTGKSIRVVTVFSLESKDSMIRLYALATKIIAVVMLLILCSTITYTILQYAYFTTISFYLPALLLLCLSGFNAAFHIDGQIDLIRNVYEYHSIY